MTSGEIVPLAQATAAAAKRAVDDTAEKAALQNLAADSPNMKAAAESYARRVAIKEAVLLRVYQPLARFLGISREYFDTQFHADMAARVADIPEEHLATPAPSVAIPAMQGLGYSVEEPSLKEMYLSLLATATDNRVADNAHPSFADVIKQLSPAEANLLLDTLRYGILPVVRLLRVADDGPGETTEINYLLNLRDTRTSGSAEQPALGVWIDNWIRLGLVEVDYSRSVVGDEAYAWVEGRPEFSKLAESDSRGVAGLRYDRGILRAKDFGLRFLDAVSYDGVPLEAAPGSNASSAHAPGDLDGGGA